MAYKQNNNPFKKVTLTNAQQRDGSGSGEQYITRAMNFDPSGVANELKNNPYAMIAEDLLRVKQGEFGRDATLKDQRDLYQSRAKGNLNAKMAAIRNNTEFYDYTDSRTGQQKQGINEKYTKPIDTNTPSVDVGSGSGSGSGSGGSGVDWQKVDAGRRQRHEYRMKHGSNDVGQNRRELKRTRKRRLRQQRREARRRERQINRRNSGGGFLARLFGF